MAANTPRSRRTPRSPRPGVTMWRQRPGGRGTAGIVTAHRAYRPLLPAGNKYLQQKWDEASYQLHREKVDSAKPTLNTTPPQTYSHLAVKLKNQKLEEERTAKIQRENNLLKEKISLIMRTTGGVDNQNYHDRKSLGTEKRQQELLRITKENQMILVRLGRCRSHYSLRSWNQDWIRTLTVRDSIALYPRGRTQKGQENPTKKSSPAQKRKEGKGIQQDLATDPGPADKSVPADSHENPDSSGSTQNTAGRSPGGPGDSSRPHTPAGDSKS